MKSFCLISYLLIASISSYSQPWEVMHPGGGGAVMGIDCDPNTPGKMFQSSDMEGVNISYDYGLSWHNTGLTQRHTFKFNAKVKPGNSNIVLSGGIFGMDISYDGGETWTYIEDFLPNPDGLNDRGSVASIAWDPSNPNYVYAAHGWKNREDRLNKVTPPITQTPSGKRKIGVSTDGGETWNFYTWENIDGLKNCYGVVVHPTNGNVYLSTENGIYKSEDHGQTWNILSAPSGVSAYTKGIAISANGEYIYATYRMTASNTDDYEIFAARTSDLIWYNVHGNDITIDSRYYDPAIDPRDKENTHHILIAALHKPQAGLWEGFVTWPASGAPSFSWDQIFLESNNVNANGYTYDHGWRPTSAKCSHHLYTPASWPRSIWTTTGQGIFVGDPTISKYARWEPRHCERVGTKNNEGLYKTRGYESTWTYDMDAADQFVIQGQADNGIAQSWDNGQSWQRHLPIANFSSCNAVFIHKNRNPKVLLVGGAVNAYGGGSPSDPGHLYARTLPDGAWKSGGVHDKIYSICDDPFNNNVVYMGTETGLYIVSGLTAWTSSNVTPGITNITGTIGTTSVRDAIADPNVNGRIYVLCSKGTYRVDNATSGMPVWTKINDFANGGHGGTRGFYVWSNEPTTYIAISNAEEAFLSSDGGQTWSNILNRAKVLEVCPLENNSTIQTDAMLPVEAMAGIRSDIYAVVAADVRKGYAVLKGSIDENNNVTWNDFTGEVGDRLIYPRARKARIASSNGKTYLYVGTSGMGVWRKEIPGTTSIFNVNKPSTSIEISPNPASTHININTNDNKQGLLEILSTNGKVLYSQTLRNKTECINIKEFKPGMYVLVFRNKTQKFIKMKSN